ncbi:MAG: outer membrane protein assembly factor BamA [Nitrospirota bacterium]
MRNKFFLLIIPLVCIFFLMSSLKVRGEERELKINRVEVSGNRKIESSTIKIRLKSKEGNILSQDILKEDIKTIYNMGYFNDVSVKKEESEDGLKIIFMVTERPIVTEITYEGNKEILTEKLKEKVTIKTNDFLDEKEAKLNAENLQRYYYEEGYHNAVVTPVINKIDEDKSSVTFFIKEEAKSYIKNISLKGNKVFSSRKIRKVMDTRRYFWLTSWLTQSGIYNKEKLENDIEEIKDLYLNNGYLNIQVGRPLVTLSDDREWFFIEIEIFEGEQFRIKDIGFVGNHILSDRELMKIINLKEDDIAKKERIRDDIGIITEAYGERGYVFAHIVPQITTDEESKTADIIFEVSEGEKVKVREINISGNDKTRDKVIRREIKLDEQDTMNTRLLRRSFQRLYNLNFFENVEITPEQIGKDQMDLNVSVIEKSTGTFSIAGGYSSVDKIVGIVDVTIGNLFGRGQLLKTKIETGGVRKSYSITFREPYLFDYNLSARFDLFNQQRKFDTYTEKRIGGDIIFGKPFTEYVRGSLSYKREGLEVFDIIDTASTDVLNQRGKTLTSSIGLTLSRDTRDNFINPSSGSKNFISIEQAGLIMGGDNDFIKIIGDSSKYFPIKWGTVLSLHSRIGYAEGIKDKPLPLGERFFVGGINTIRGFDFGKAGPIDITGEALGAHKELIFNIEYLIPLVPEAGIKTLVFFDAGKGFGENEGIDINGLRYSTGAGIRWISPIGPLRLEWGYVLNRRPGETQRPIEFSIGSLF